MLTQRNNPSPTPEAERRAAPRLTKLQSLLVAHIAKYGGAHIYISRAWTPPVDSGLRGYTWEGVNLSLQALVRRGVLRVVKNSFFYLVDAPAAQSETMSSAAGTTTPPRHQC